MRSANPLRALGSSPTVVGAVTTLIVIVAVFLAYNANNGLPFVPVYRVSVEVPDASRLTNNNEIRIGGSRVGVVESIDPLPAENGAIARLNLKLDRSAGPLPQDSIFRVRYRSSFGLKYLEIVRGEGEPAPEGFTFDGTDDGDVCRLPTNPAQFASSLGVPARNGCFQGQTEFDDINNTFDTQTRTNARTNLEGFGNGFAGRGTSLNDAIHTLEPLFRDLKPVAQVLTQSDTRFNRFFPELADAARIVAPVAEQQARFFTNAGIAFAAISSDPVALQETISEGVPTLEAGISLLPRQRPFLRKFTLLSHELRPGVTDLRATLPVLNEAVEVGTPVLNEAPRTNRDLRDALAKLNRLVTQPTTRLTLQRLGDTFDSAKRLAAHVVPAQTVCNYWNYWFTLLPEHITERDQVGYGQRVVLVQPPPGPVTIDTSPAPPGQVTIPGEVEAPVGGYSGLGANGREGPTGVFKPFELPIQHDYLYDAAGRNGEDCHAGQDGYILGQHLLEGQPKSNPASIAFGAPGHRGPTTNYWHRDGTREVRDTRVAGRQPQTWQEVGG